MALNFKKALLTGSALVAVSFAHVGAACAAGEFSTDTGGAGTWSGTFDSGNTWTGAWDNNDIRVNETGTIIVDGSADMGNSLADNAIIAGATGKHITIQNSPSNTGQHNIRGHIDRNGHDGMTLSIVNNAGGANIPWDVALTGNIDLGNGGLNITGDATYGSSGATLYAMGNITSNGLSLNNTAWLTLGGSKPRTITTDINGATGGTVRIANSSAAGVVFDGNLNVKALTFGGAAEKVTLNGAAQINDIVDIANKELVFNGATFTMANGMLIADGGKLHIDGATEFTGANANIVGAGGSSVVISNTAGDVVFNGKVQTTTLTFDANGSAIFKGAGGNSVANAIAMDASNRLGIDGQDFSANGGINGTGALILTDGTLNATTAKTATVGLLTAGGTSAVGANMKVAVNGFTSVLDNGTLTLSGGGGSTLAQIALNTNGVIAFDHATGGGNAVTVSGNITGGADSVLKNGAGDLTLNGAGMGAGTLQYTGAGKITVNNTGTINKVNFANNNGDLVFGNNATGITGNVTTGGSNIGKITTGTGAFTFGGTIGGSGAALNTLSLGGNATFNGAAYIKTLADAADDDLIVNANLDIADAWSVQNVSISGGSILSGGAGTISGTLTNTSGNNTVSSQVAVTGATTVTDGKLTLSGNNTALNGGAVVNGGGTLAFTQAGSASVGGTGINGDRLEIGAGMVNVTAGTVNLSNTVFNGGGTLALANDVTSLGTVTSVIDFKGNQTATVNIGDLETVNASFITQDSVNPSGRIVTSGAGKTVTFNGNIGSTGNLALDSVTIGHDAAIFEGQLHTKSLSATDKNLTFKGNTSVADGFATTGSLTLGEAGSANVRALSTGAAVNTNVGSLINAGGANTISNKITVSGTTTISEGTLTQSSGGMSLQGLTTIANGAKLVSGSTLSTMNGVTGAGTLELGAGAIVQLSGTVDVANIVYGGAGGQVSLMGGGAALDSAVNFKTSDGLLTLNNRTDINKAITTETNNTGSIIMSAIGARTFAEDVGAANLALKSISLGNDATFKGALHTKTLAANNKNITLEGTTNVEDGITTTGSLTLNGGTVAVTGGDSSVGSLTSAAGANLIANKIVVSGATTVTAGALTVSHANSELGAVSLGTNTLTFGGSDIGEVTGVGGTLNFTGATTVGGNIGVTAANLAKVTVGAGAVNVGAHNFYANAVEFTGAGSLNLASVTNNVSAQNIDFMGQNGTVTFGNGLIYSGTALDNTGNGQGNIVFGTGLTHVTGNLGVAGHKLNEVTFGGAAEIDNAVYATTLNLNGDTLAKHATFDTGVYFAGDHKLTLDNATRIIGDISNAAAGHGTIDFKTSFDGITGSILSRLKDFKLGNNADVTGSMIAATDTHIGTHRLDVGGAFFADENTTLHFTVDNKAAHGQIVSGGAATIHADTNVKVTVNDPTDLSTGTKLTLVDGTGGNGVAVLNNDKLETLNTVLLKFAQDTDNKEDLVIVVNRLNVNDGATGDNNQSVAETIQQVIKNVNDSDVKSFEAKLLGAKTQNELNDLLASVLPDLSGGSVAASVNVGAQTSMIVNSRVTTVRSGGDGLSGISSGDRWQNRHMWGQAFGARSDQGERNGIAGYDADTYGFVVGMDGEITESTRLGVALSYADTKVKGKDINRSTSDIDSYQLSFYGDTDFGDGYFATGQLGYIYSDVDGKRSDVGGVVGRTATANYHNNQYIARGEFGRAFDAGHGISLTPSILANYSYIDVGSYSEKGAGGLTLRNVKTDEMQMLEFGMNLIASADFDDGKGGTLTPQIHGGYRYDVIGDELATTASFAGGGNAFSVKGMEPAQGTFNAGFGLKWSLSSNIDLNAQYDYQTKSDYDEHSGFIRAGYRF